MCYKGFSEDGERRLLHHLESKGRYTSGTDDWKIVCVQEFENKSEALMEEKRLKRLNRSSIKNLSMDKK